MNRYPVWKYAIIVIVLLVGLIYALPNFFGEAPAVQVSAANMTVTRTITLRHSDVPDFEIQGSGIPNYLGAVALSPDGASAWVPSKQDNIKRGTLRNGANLNFQNTVRAITSRINLTTGVEDLASRVDVDNASLASAALFDTYGNYLFVALETSREVAVLDVQGRYVDCIRYVPSYLTADVQITYRPAPQWEISLVGRNLLDRQHPEHGFEPLATTAEVPRSFYGKITWRF